MASRALLLSQFKQNTFRPDPSFALALNRIRTTLSSLDTSLYALHGRKPLSALQSRIKTSKSLFDKMSREDMSITQESMDTNINDIAGVRAVCGYLDDVYLLADALVDHTKTGIHLLSRKDYISHPKPNGYRSLHMIVSVPVPSANPAKNVKVEVQFRTVAMDFWGSLEYEKKYRGISDGLAARLKRCADMVHDVDVRMLDIRRQFEAEAEARGL